MQPKVSVISGALPAIRIEGLEPLAGWEYSLNEQRTWIRASGQVITFAGNHLRRIWSRQVDAAGNVSAAGADTLWIQQTGTERTAYAVEIAISPE